MLGRLGALERVGHARDRLVGLPKNPGYPCHENQHGHSGILASGPSSRSVGLPARAEQFDGAFERLAGLDDASHEHENHSLPSYPIDQCRPIAARFGRIRQTGNGFEGLRQLAPHDAHSGEPEHYLEVFRRLSEPLAQLTRTAEGRYGRARGRPLRGNEARPKNQLKIKLEPVPAIVGRQPACQLDPSLQVCDGLEIGRAQGCVLAAL